MKYRTQHSEKRYASTVAIDVTNPDENRTLQAFKDEADINKLMARYQRQGFIPPDTRQAIYADVSDIPDFLEARQRVDLAITAFNALPADVRLECGNDPAVFLQRIQDPAWAQKHGLLEATPSPAAPTPSAAGQAAPESKDSEKKA